MAVKFSCKSFEDLDIFQLYQIMELRQEVFVVEQDCPYLDADGKDQHGYHLCGWDENQKLVAYARLLPKVISYENYASIGRVVTSMSARGTGVGRILMLKAVEQIFELYGTGIPIKISAQSHLEKFYNSIGFVKVGEGYLEDDIPHIGMVYDQMRANRISH